MQHIRAISAPAKAQQAKQSATGFLEVLEEIFGFVLFMLEFVNQRASLDK